MKKTFNINVAGIPFTIDDDAYTLLSDYLDTIEHTFASQEDSMELISDIESRIAELLIEHTSAGSPIVSASDVEDVIRRVGQPEEIIGEEDSVSVNPVTGNMKEEETISERITPPPYVSPMPPAQKKLFRDGQNAMLGGVCAGFAWYFNADPTVVRLLTVLLTIVSMSSAGIAYLILWIVVPEARTPFEKMQMTGEQPTMENIGKTVTDSFKEETGQTSPGNPTRTNANFGYWLAKFFGVCARIIVILGLIVAIPVLLGLSVSLIGCVFALIIMSTGMGAMFMGDSIPEWYSEAGTIPVWGVLCGIGVILALGIPLFLLVRMAFNSKQKPLAKGVKKTLIALWVIGFIGGAAAAGMTINLANKKNSHVSGEKVKVINTSPLEENIDIEEVFPDSLSLDTLETLAPEKE